MMTDIWTVMWKEWQELLQGGDRGRLGLLLFLGVFGVFMPLQMGRGWVKSPVMPLAAVWVSLFLVTTVVADSFAGERERHTLETLLASRLPDRAILLGKVGAAVTYGWGVTLIGLLISLVTVNVVHRGSGLLLFPTTVGLGAVILSLLSAGLAAGVGVLVSLRASSVRQAQQAMSVTLMALIFGVAFGAQALPVAWKVRLARMLAGMDATQALGVSAVVLALLDMGLLAAAMRRFRRGRLIVGG